MSLICFIKVDKLSFLSDNDDESLIVTSKMMRYQDVPQDYKLHVPAKKMKIWLTINQWASTSLMLSLLASIYVLMFIKQYSIEVSIISFSILAGTPILCVTLIKINPYKRFAIVSHPWLSKDHPDPESMQIDFLMDKLREYDYVWIDYCSLPQEPRVDNEHTIFMEGLINSNFLYSTLDVVFDERTPDGVPRYNQRGWCQFEKMCSESRPLNMTLGVILGSYYNQETWLLGIRYKLIQFILIQLMSLPFTIVFFTLRLLLCHDPETPFVKPVKLEELIMTNQKDKMILLSKLVI